MNNDFLKSVSQMLNEMCTNMNICPVCSLQIDDGPVSNNTDTIYQVKEVPLYAYLTVLSFLLSMLFYFFNALIEMALRFISFICVRLH